jgi:hypothetical protein
MLLGASASRADDTGVSKVIAFGLAGIAAGIFDSTYTVYDAFRLSRGEPGNPYAGMVEVLGAAPQIVVASLVAANPPVGPGSSTCRRLGAVGRGADGARDPERRRGDSPARTDATQVRAHWMRRGVALLGGRRQRFPG